MDIQIDLSQSRICPMIRIVRISFYVTNNYYSFHDIYFKNIVELNLFEYENGLKTD